MSINPVVLDVECTTHNHGNSFDARNNLCYVGCYDGDDYHLFDIEYSNSSYREQIDSLQLLLSGFDCIVGFNLKFDLHWLRRYGIDFRHCSVWDCQLVEFILSNQSVAYPSLDATAIRYGLDNKLDTVNIEYWSKGVDTPDIPREILEDYLKQDLLLTHQIYLIQLKEVEND